MFIRLALSASVWLNALATAKEIIEIPNCEVEYAYGTNPVRYKSVDGTLRLDIPTYEGPVRSYVETEIEKMRLEAGGSTKHFAILEFKIDGRDYKLPIEMSMKTMLAYKQLHDAPKDTLWAIQHNGVTPFRPATFKQIKFGVGENDTGSPFLMFAEAQYERRGYDQPKKKGEMPPLLTEKNTVKLTPYNMDKTQLPGSWRPFYENYQGSVFLLPIHDDPIFKGNLEFHASVSSPVVRLGETEKGKVVVAFLDHWEEAKSGLRSEIPIYQVDANVLEIPRNAEDVDHATRILEVKSRSNGPSITVVNNAGEKVRHIKGEEKPLPRKVRGLKINTIMIPARFEGDLETAIAEQVAKAYPAPFKFTGTTVPKITQGPVGFNCGGEWNAVRTAIGRLLKF